MFLLFQALSHDRNKFCIIIIIIIIIIVVVVVVVVIIIIFTFSLKLLWKYRWAQSYILASGTKLACYGSVLKATIWLLFYDMWHCVVTEVYQCISQNCCLQQTEAAWSPQVSVHLYQTMWCHILRDSDFRRELSAWTNEQKQRRPIGRLCLRNLDLIFTFSRCHVVSGWRQAHGAQTVVCGSAGQSGNVHWS
jgi:hypothetical protein